MRIERGKRLLTTVSVDDTGRKMFGRCIIHAGDQFDWRGCVRAMLEQNPALIFVVLRNLD